MQAPVAGSPEPLGALDELVGLREPAGCGEHHDVVNVAEGVGVVVYPPGAHLGEIGPSIADGDAAQLQAQQQRRHVLYVDGGVRHGPDERRIGIANLGAQQLENPRVIARLEQEQAQVPPQVVLELVRRAPVLAQAFETGAAFVVPALHERHVCERMRAPHLGRIALDRRPRVALRGFVAACLLVGECSARQVRRVAVDVLVPVRCGPFDDVAHPVRTTVPEQLELQHAVCEQVGGMTIEQALERGGGLDPAPFAGETKGFQIVDGAVVAGVDAALRIDGELLDGGRVLRIARAMQHPGLDQLRQGEFDVGGDCGIETFHGVGAELRVPLDAGVAGAGRRLAGGPQNMSTRIGRAMHVTGLLSPLRKRRSRAGFPAG